MILGADVNLVRHDLQTEYVKATAGILATETSYDNGSKATAWLTLRSVKDILEQQLRIGDTQTQAHRANLVFLVDKALSVNN